MRGRTPLVADRPPAPALLLLKAQAEAQCACHPEFHQVLPLLPDAADNFRLEAVDLRYLHSHQQARLVSMKAALPHQLALCRLEGLGERQ